MKEFDVYIFDLYGTLVDIWADEQLPELWNKAAKHMNEEFGTKWDGKALFTRYKEIVEEEKKLLSAKNGADFPEILIETVWLRLIREGRNYKKDADDEESCKIIEDKNISTLCEQSPEILSFCTWFRETSRTRFKLFDGVNKTFEALRKKGKKLFLLSNAQRAYTAKELVDLGLDDKFDEVFISSDKTIMKPQKEFLELLIKENSLSVDKCVMIGNDIFSDVGVAVKNGMNSIFLNTNGYSKKKIHDEISKLGINGSALMPVVIEDGKIEKIL